MDADFSIELGRDDPALELPWTDPEGKLAYFDLKRHPELLARVEEAQQFAELADFLRVVNSPKSILESAKCDAWSTDKLAPDEDVYGTERKFVSYVDLFFSAHESRQSFALHERLVKRLVELLRRVPETPSAAEVAVRRCYFHVDGETKDGFYCTLYVTGYGEDEERARQNWEIALKLVGNAILQLSSAGIR